MNQKKNSPFRVLVVCMGNICRSPTMEAVLTAKALREGLELVVDSAGTAAYHVGERPDKRSQAAGELRGYDFSSIRARQVCVNDFVDFDLILCADKANMRELKALCPASLADKIKLYLDYGDMGYGEVPDPYYGGEQGFELVLDLVENASDGLINVLKLDEV